MMYVAATIECFRLLIIVNKQPKLIATISLIIILYYFYKLKFTNTKEFFTFIKTKIKEGFEPCSSNNIGYCDNITDAGIRAVVSGCPLLRSLNIGGCGKITDAGIRALATGLPHLQS